MPEPEFRPSLAEIRAHDWMKGSVTGQDELEKLLGRSDNLTATDESSGSLEKQASENEGAKSTGSNEENRSPNEQEKASPF